MSTPNTIPLKALPWLTKFQVEGVKWIYEKSGLRNGDQIGVSAVQSEIIWMDPNVEVVVFDSKEAINNQTPFKIEDLINADEALQKSMGLFESVTDAIQKINATVEVESRKRVTQFYFFTGREIFPIVESILRKKGYKVLKTMYEDAHRNVHFIVEWK